MLQQDNSVRDKCLQVRPHYILTEYLQTDAYFRSPPNEGNFNCQTYSGEA